MDNIQARISKLKGGFIADVLKLVSGTTIAQILSILVVPFLARLYTPEAFGILAQFTSLISILSVNICLRYELAIMLPERDEEAANVLAASFWVSVTLSLLMVPIVGLAGTQILNLIEMPELIPYAWLVPIVLFFGGLGSGHPALNYWTSRTRRYGTIAGTRVASSVVTLAGKLGAGLAGYATAGSLIIAAALGAIISPLVLAWRTWKDNGALLRKNIHVRDTALMLNRYRRFPLITIWSSWLNTLSWQLPVFFITFFFSSTEVGYYSMGNTMLLVPLSLISNALSQVFYQRASVAKTQGTLANLVESTFRRLVTLGVFPVFILTFIGRDLMSIVFGANWTEAGIYTQILSIWALFWFISSPMSTIFSVLEQQGSGLKINVILFISRLVALLIGGMFTTARITLALYAVSGILAYGYLILLVMKLSGASITKATKTLLTSSLSFAPAGLILALLYFFSIHPVVIIGISGVILLAYLGYILRKEPQIYALFKRNTAQSRS